jgi:hypothetical protein
MGHFCSNFIRVGVTSACLLVAVLRVQPAEKCDTFTHDTALLPWTTISPIGIETVANGELRP